MTARRIVAVATAVVVAAVAFAGRGVAGKPAHDFSPATMAAYLSLRFSSAVPPGIIARVLAGEGFSQRDLEMVGSGARLTPDALARVVTVRPRMVHVTRAQATGRNRLPCPKTDATRCELDTEAEPDIAINPSNPRNIVGVFQKGRFPNGGAVDTGWATSFNGGKTWAHNGSSPNLTVAVTKKPDKGPGPPYERASDPVVVFDRKHHEVLINSIGVSGKGCEIYCDSALTVNISHDGGKSFGSPVVMHEDVVTETSAPTVFNDKNWMAVDNNPSSPYYGRIYGVWDQVKCPDPDCDTAPASQPVVMVTSDDGGQTWSKLITVANEQPGPVKQEVGAYPIVLPNGHIVVIYAAAAPGAYTFAGSFDAVTSTDGGKTWSQAVQISPADPFAEESNGMRAPNIPSATFGPGGKIYAVWQDQSFTPGRNDIVMSSSADEGKTWTSPVNVTPNESSLDHFTPSIAAVGSPPRKLYLSYRVHPPEPVSSAPTVKAVIRVIRGGGKLVKGPTKLYKASDARFAAYTTIAGQGHFAFFGDYSAMAGSRRYAFPIWAQSQKFSRQKKNPTNTHQRAFVARAR